MPFHHRKLGLRLCHACQLGLSVGVRTSPEDLRLWAWQPEHAPFSRFDPGGSLSAPGDREGGRGPSSSSCSTGCGFNAQCGAANRLRPSITASSIYPICKKTTSSAHPEKRTTADRNEAYESPRRPFGTLWAHQFSTNGSDLPHSAIRGSISCTSFGLRSLFAQSPGFTGIPPPRSWPFRDLQLSLPACLKELRNSQSDAELPASLSSLFNCSLPDWTLRRLCTKKNSKPLRQIRHVKGLCVQCPRRCCGNFPLLPTSYFRVADDTPGTHKANQSHRGNAPRPVSAN